MISARLQKIIGRDACERCGNDEVWCETCVAKLVAWGKTKRRASKKQWWRDAEKVVLTVTIVALAARLVTDATAGFTSGIFIGFWVAKMPQILWPGLVKAWKSWVRAPAQFPLRVTSPRVEFPPIAPQPGFFTIPALHPMRLVHCQHDYTNVPGDKCHCYDEVDRRAREAARTLE